jgi:chromosome segregation ATPase
MGLGSTAKKLQMLADTAEKMFHRLNEVREQVETTQTTVQDTGDRVQQLETEIVEQRAILEAIATELDIDLDAVSADAHIHDAEAEAASTDAVDDTETDAETDAVDPDDPEAEA